MQIKSSYTLLLRRIRDQFFQDQRSKLLQHTELIFVHLFISIAITIIFRFPNALYNSWNVPFVMNLKQFRDHLETNYNLLDFWGLLSFHSILFQPQYLQVELGIGTIASDASTVYTGYSEYIWSESLKTTFDRVVEPTINTPNMTLYIKFAANGQSYADLQYPYRFQSFSITTLRCIVKQIGIPARQFLNWPEKQLYTKSIEEIYQRNPSLINKTVIKRCGILLGYLYGPSTESINLNESSPRILRRFDSETLFIVIGIDTITEVLPRCIVISDNNRTENIDFSLNTIRYQHDRAEWLHARLMILCSQYRYLCEQQALRDEEEERQRHLQRMIEQERERRLQYLIDEETEHQIREYGDDFNRILQGITSASPRVIAEYRMNGPLTINDGLMFEECPICITDYQMNQQYARWSCPGQHIFHFNCMLDVLRTDNRCPMCRHAVEAANILDAYVSNWLMQLTLLDDL
ncbi:unnamed protein product [Rotaria socialis]|uniref:RING-type domain-containing protein n=1 Tax=Rotaria socialis TaxID=392032 RepID=A0A821UGW2_9BILA|nr:unnamed protein product [Rotaria socialis]CAF4889993.1 unnamed protein product [Rotaria socialis]